MRVLEGTGDECHKRIMNSKDVWFYKAPVDIFGSLIEELTKR